MVSPNSGPAALMPTLEHLSERVLGYAIHTNRELGFMLGGSKPLAVFSDAYGQFPDVVLRYLRIFDRYVARGAFVKRDYVELRGKPPKTSATSSAPRMTRLSPAA